LRDELERYRSRAGEVETVASLQNKLKEAELKIEFGQKVREIHNIPKVW
jgi:hypothetical protein